MTTQLERRNDVRASHDNVDLKARPPYSWFVHPLRGTVTRLEAAAVHRWLDRHSIPLLRISMGVIIFGFGILKYFPGVSPAENLVLSTTNMLTLGLMPSRVAMVLLATVECAIGLSLIISRGLRVTIYVLMMWVLGILSPVVLLPARLFSGPDHAPTLEGQYVLKDIVLLTASLVIAAATVRRAKTDAHAHRETELAT